VQGHSSVDDGAALGHGGHVCVHFLVHQPESDRFVADESLQFLYYFFVFN